MIKYDINRLVIAQVPTFVFSLRKNDIAPQLAEVDAFNDEALCGVIRFFGDGADLPPAEMNDGVITLYCNLSQFPAVVSFREEDDVFIYFRSDADAGLGSGPEPFERTRPIRL
jgi:hypothetical protein